MSEQSNGFHPAAILSFDGELDLPTTMRPPRTARSAKIDQQFATQTQRMDLIERKGELGEAAMERLQVGSDRAFRDGLRGLFAIVDEEEDPRIRELLQLRLEKESFNDLSKSVTAIKRIAMQGVADIEREAIEEPAHDTPTVIEVQPRRPGLLKRLLG